MKFEEVLSGMVSERIETMLIRLPIKKFFERQLTKHIKHIVLEKNRDKIDVYSQSTIEHIKYTYKKKLEATSDKKLYWSDLLETINIIENTIFGKYLERIVSDYDTYIKNKYSYKLTDEYMDSVISKIKEKEF